MDQQLFGIEELYNSGPDASIDIVAVHGLNGDAFTTWTTDKTKVCWLNNENLLPRYLPQARVLTWGYNANVASLNGRTTSANRIMHHAQTLVAQLQADRDLEGISQRPIIFICHSLGGIIVKRALIYSKSRTAGKIAHLHNIYTCTHGILFFSTPHTGSRKAHLLASLQKLTSLTTPGKILQSDSSLLRALESDSETLQNITDQFAPLMRNFHIFFLWEQERTDLKYTRDYIVDESSAAPILDETERAGIAADHRGMCKFEGKDEAGFRTVVAAVRRWTVEAGTVVAARCERAGEMLRDEGWNQARELVGGVGVVGGVGDPRRVGHSQLASEEGERRSGLLEDAVVRM